MIMPLTSAKLSEPEDAELAEIRAKIQALQERRLELIGSICLRMRTRQMAEWLAKSQRNE
jgi:hypothetical protein